MKQISKELVEFLKERNWYEAVPADVAKSISIEAAEILEHFQWNNFSVDDIKNDAEKFEKLKMEIADVFIYLLQMAEMFGLDPEEIVKEKLEFVRNKYPVELIKKDRKAYQTIKRQYRETEKK